MKPYAEGEGWTLYHGDCRAVLPTLTGIDAIVTDPPFGIGEKMSGGTWGAASKYADFRRWDIAPSCEQIEAIRRAAPLVIIWGGNYFTLPPSRCWLVWDKQNAVPTMADCEMAWTSFDRPTKRFSAPVGVHEYGHPTEKPVSLMRWCLSFLPQQCAVCDPFTGSGTTGVACRQLGRRFVGIEIDEGYCAIAARRIASALTPNTYRDWTSKTPAPLFDPPCTPAPDAARLTP